MPYSSLSQSIITYLAIYDDMHGDEGKCEKGQLCCFQKSRHAHVTWNSLEVRVRQRIDIIERKKYDPGPRCTDVT